jgi:predicted enzyme related to lactoylglutathione lyase
LFALVGAMVAFLRPGRDFVPAGHDEIRDTATMPAAVVETFVSVPVSDMRRATAFYVGALGAVVAHASPGWSSLTIAGVRVGLAFSSEHPGGPTGLHFAVRDLAEARAEVERAGGQVVRAAIEVAPGVIVSEVTDSEGNELTLAVR